jgi:hypothetical protein
VTPTRPAAWYERLLGAPPSFLPNDTEAVWELADHRCVFIKVRPVHARHAMHTFFGGDRQRCPRLDACGADGDASHGLDRVDQHRSDVHAFIPSYQAEQVSRWLSSLRYI